MDDLKMKPAEAAKTEGAIQRKHDAKAASALDRVYESLREEGRGDGLEADVPEF